MLKFLKVPLSHIIQYKKGVTGRFQTIVPNVPKITFNTNSSKYTPYIVYCTTLSTKFTRFALQPSIFELQAILRQVHWITPKLPWTLKGQRYPIYTCNNYPTPFSSTAGCFWVTGDFDTSALHDPKIAWSTKRCQRCPYMLYFTPFCSMISHFQDIGIFHFPIVHKDKFQSFFKKKNKWIWIFKIPIRNFCEDCHREHSEKVWKRVITVGGKAFWNFHPHRVPC